MEEDTTNIAIFNGKTIRRKLVGDKWFFSVIDVVYALTDSTIPKRYWADLKAKLIEEGFEAYDKIVLLKLIAEDDKLRETDCADTEGIFRIIQSIPSKKAEPFKRWLAKIGYLKNLHEFRFLMVQKFQTNTQEFFDERIQEIENPELAQERMKNSIELC
ncbi:MAG: Bro-N domain-containing protein [Nanoarchaeota archaeon]|nr:Bro-N domain-containing protein [Nanoarchaeota archaeon]